MRVPDDAAALLAIDPRGLGGAVVRGSARHGADAWARRLVALLPAGAPVRRVPAAIGDDRLLGGLDLAATLAAERPVIERGVLAAAHGGVVLLPADTTRPATWTHVARALDAKAVVVERDGLAAVHDADFAAVAIDDTRDDETTPVPAAFADRVAFLVDLAETDGSASTPDAEAVAAARARLAAVRCDDAAVEALGVGAESLGITSVRVLRAAVAAARASAALDGRDAVGRADLARAARLVLAPRATRTEQDERPAPDAPPSPPPESSGDDTDAADGDTPMSDVVVRAARAALPPGLLAAAAAATAHGRLRDAGRAGADRVAGTRGRQVGTRPGMPRGGARIDLLATLRAAAPLQRLRRREHVPNDQVPNGVVRVRRDDLRVRRCAVPARRTTIFVVDASGSAALHRLAEAKGAVEAMLADGYARRERVAVIAFRGTQADVVLAPTHAPARARRAVAGLPAGGGTPLAAALDRAALLAHAARRDGTQVVVVLLTDGRANVARDGRGPRARAEADALAAAAQLRAVVDGAVVVDTAPRPEAFLGVVARTLGARHVPLPAASSRAIADAAGAARRDR